MENFLDHWIVLRLLCLWMKRECWGESSTQWKCHVFKLLTEKWFKYFPSKEVSSTVSVVKGTNDSNQIFWVNSRQEYQHCSYKLLQGSTKRSNRVHCLLLGEKKISQVSQASSSKSLLQQNIWIWSESSTTGNCQTQPIRSSTVHSRQNC